VAGTWYFGYDDLKQELLAIWQGVSSTAHVSPENSRILLRVWSSGSTTVSPDLQSGNHGAIVEESINLIENPSMQKSIDIALDKYLVFAVQGSGPAVGETVCIGYMLQDE
jgi:hypothetical protein